MYSHYIKVYIGLTKLLTIDIDTGDHPSIPQKPYTLPLKHDQWINEELEMLENAGVISRSVSPCSIVIIPKKVKPGDMHQECLCIDHHALNTLLSPVIKVHPKAQGVFSLVLLPKIDEIYPMWNGSTIYSSLDCTFYIVYISLWMLQDLHGLLY